MDRLISTYDVVKIIDKHTTEDRKLDEDISVILEEIPTAYNVDARCKRMAEIGEKYCNSVICDKECENCDHGVLIKTLIDIVRRCGKKA